MKFNQLRQGMDCKIKIKKNLYMDKNKVSLRFNLTPISSHMKWPRIRYATCGGLYIIAQYNADKFKNWKQKKV